MRPRIHTDTEIGDGGRTLRTDTPTREWWIAQYAGSVLPAVYAQHVIERKHEYVLPDRVAEEAARLARALVEQLGI